MINHCHSTISRLQYIFPFHNPYDLTRCVRELNLIPIERLLNKYLSTGEGKRKGFQITKEITGLMWAGVARKWGLG